MATNAAENGELIEVSRRIVHALEAAQDALAGNASLVRGCIEGLENGEEVVEVVRSLPAAASRTATTIVDDELNKARTQFRTKFIAACLAGGMSRREIADNMGSSHQLVSRYVASSHEPS